MKTILALTCLMLSLSAMAETTNVIYAIPATNQSQASPCGFSRIMTASYQKPQPAWGWYASNNSPCRVFADPRRKICVEVFCGGTGDHIVGTNSVTFTPGTNNPCRFELYFNKAVQTNPFPLTIVNFNP